MSEYEQQATELLNKLGVTITVEYFKNDYYFPKDKDKRDIYNVTIKRGNRLFTFTFGQSTANSKKLKQYPNNREFSLSGNSLDGRYKIHPERAEEFLQRNYTLEKNLYDLKRGDGFYVELGTPPTNYDILACLQKYDVGTFENFCGDFGYDIEDITVENTYNAVTNEYKNMTMLFTDSELEMLSEIQ